MDGAPPRRSWRRAIDVVAAAFVAIGAFVVLLALPRPPTRRTPALLVRTAAVAAILMWAASIGVPGYLQGYLGLDHGQGG